MGRHVEAEARYEDCIREFRQLPRADRLDGFIWALQNHGSNYLNYLDEPDKAEPLLDEALSLRTSPEARDDAGSLRRILRDLAHVAHLREKPADAMRLYAEAYSRLQESHGDEDPETSAALFDYAKYVEENGDVALAESLFRRLLEVRRARWRVDHESIAQVLGILGNLEKRQGNFDQAVGWFEQELAMRQRLFGDRSDKNVVAILALATTHQAAREYRSAIVYYRLAAEIVADPIARSKHLIELGRLCIRCERVEEATRHFQEALRAHVESGELLSHRMYETWRTILREIPEGERVNWITNSIGSGEEFGTPTSKALFKVAAGRALGLSETESGVRMCEDAINEIEGLQGDHHEAMGLALFQFGRLLHETWSDADKSESVARRAVELHRQLAEESNEFKDELAIDLDLLGSVLAYQSKRYDEAAAAYTESLDLRFQLHGAADHDLIAWLYQHLGYTENRRGNFSASDAWYCKGLDTRRRLGDSAGTPIRVLLGSWVDALQSRGDYGACEKLIEAESPSVKTRASLFNRVAWRMLTDGSKANVEPAMEFALRANELTSFDDAVYLDTLALAQHRSGESEAALETQQKALRILAPDHRSRAEFESRLSEYRNAVIRGSDSPNKDLDRRSTPRTRPAPVTPNRQD